MDLQDFDADRFLRDHWQKAPLLIRNPWAAWRNPLDPDELAGLACEEGVESRLVRRTRTTWKVEHGPFKPKRFARLDGKPWTLLVQAVDHSVPAVAALLAPFRFVPDWRIDDVMVSVASDGGGVGPHFDQYDVFLIQGAGRRRWRVGGRCDAATPLLPHDDLRLLADFEAVDEWVLDPGDILYLPPGIAHDGVAVGDGCMTYSVGFRAPSRGELVSGWCDHLLEHLPDDDRYADPDLARAANPGEIAPAALDRLHAMVTSALRDRAAFARWFGTYSSTPRDPDAVRAPDVPPAVIAARLAEGGVVCRSPASRFGFIRRDAGALTLFVDGAAFDCAGATAAFAEALCAGDAVAVAVDATLAPETAALIADLAGQGSVTVDPTG